MESEGRMVLKTESGMMPSWVKMIIPYMQERLEEEKRKEN